MIERPVKRSSFGKVMRKTLSDITNSPALSIMSKQDEKNKLDFSPGAKSYVDQLLKENMSLVKAIEERKKIIELSGAELRRLRITCQKFQLQNRELAQTNSQLLAELNLGREKTKALQHELMCKDALLKAKNLELEKSATAAHLPITCAFWQKEEEVAPAQTSQKNDDNKHCDNKKRNTKRSQSMGAPTTSKHDADKEKNDNKRHRLKRQSALCRSQEPDPAEDLFEIEETKFPTMRMLARSANESSPGNFESSAKREESGTRNSSPKAEDPTASKRPFERPSLGRPVRRATERVQSYKEIPLNVKMRRVE